MSADDEWAIIEPMIPPARTGGRKRQTDVRVMMLASRSLTANCSAWL
jgi:transposase